MRALRRTLALAAATALAAVVGTTIETLPAHADDVTTVPLQGFTQTINIQGPPAVITGEIPGGAIEVTLPAAEQNRQVATQCTTIPGVPSSLCIGQPAAADNAPPIEVITEAELLPMLKDPAAREGLGWLELEAREAVRLQYDLPNDLRVERYARPEVRSYMTDRLLDIMDMYVYGVPLSVDEQRALDFIEATYQKRELILAQAAHDQFTAFQGGPCRYRPPAAPAIIKTADVQRMPAKVTTWCQAHPDFDQSMTNWVDFAPPLPSVKTFAAWGSYAAADELGLTAFSDPDVVDALAQTMIGTATALGFALAVPAGFGAAALANAIGIAAKLGRVLFPHAGRALFKAVELGVETGAQLASAGGGAAASALAGAIAAAVVAVVVVVALVVIGVATWLVIEHESVVSGMTDLLSQAKENSDPFGLDELREDLAGLPLNSELDPADLPVYRTGEERQRLVAILALLSTVMPNGSTVPDPKGVWATGPTVVDRKWVVKVAGGTAETRNEISVPQQADPDAAFEYAKVRSVAGWFVVDTADTPTKTTAPQLEPSFGYNDRARSDGSGTPRIVARAPSTLGGLIVTDPAYADGAGNALKRTSITFRNPSGQTVEARLQNPAPTYLDGPRPVAVGPRYARRPVILRPNPVGPSGQSIDPEQAVADFEFAWTVTRRDPVSGQWNEVHTSADYGTSFVPQQPGDYHARVAMTAIDHPEQQKFGAVAFSVTSPPILAPVLTLEDNGFDRLELDLQLAEDVSSDTMNVAVTWPGTFASPQGPTQTLSQNCVMTGPVTCTAQRTGPSNLLTHTVTRETDLRQPVKLKVTNSTGAVLEQELFILAGRPTIAPPPASVNSGEPGSVEVGDVETQVTMPLAPTGQDEYQAYTVATLVPSPDGGQAFALVNPETGTTTTDQILLDDFATGYAEVYAENGTSYLAVQVVPRLQEIGTHRYEFIVAQTNGTRQVVPVSIHVTPSVEDRRRAAIASTVDPLNFGVADRPAANPIILGGTAADPTYSGQMCVRLARLDFGPSGPSGTKCAPRVDFYASDGTVRPFPYEQLFPTGMDNGTYRMEAWLTQAGSRVDVQPLGVSFVLQDDDTYAAPNVWLGTLSASGTARVGRTLTATLSSVHPAAATLKYQWLRNGNPISGATKKTYVLVRADRGDRISVRVTATSTNYVKTVKTSARTAAVTG